MSSWRRSAGGSGAPRRACRSPIAVRSSRPRVERRRAHSGFHSIIVLSAIQVAKASLSQMSSHHAMRDQVAEPLVRHLVRGDGGLARAGARCVSSSGVASRTRSDERDQAGVLHRAGTCTVCGIASCRASRTGTGCRSSPRAARAAPRASRPRTRPCGAWPRGVTIRIGGFSRRSRRRRRSRTGRPRTRPGSSAAASVFGKRTTRVPSAARRLALDRRVRDADVAARDAAASAATAP